MGLTAIVTNAGRAALVNAANTGTRAVTIAQVGLSGTALTPKAGATVLPGQFKTIATLSGDVVADDTIHLIVRDESADVFTVRSLALYLADGTLFAIYGQADVLLEKSAQALMLLAIDIRFEDVDATTITFGDTNFLNPPATTERQGVVELATVAEAQAGIDALRALTPQAARSAILGWLLAQDGAGSGVDADLLDGQHGSYYTNIAARLGYVPWGPTNDGAGSGLDADLLDGLDSSYFVNIPARLGYTPVNKAGDNVTGTFVFGTAGGNRAEARASGDLHTRTGPDRGILRFGDSNARYIEYNGSRFYFNECEIYSGPSNSLTWNAGNDGAGSGLDADLLDGQQGSWYADIAARLGFTPVQQGTGIGQLPNAIKMGWNGSKLQLTVDATDQGNIVTEPNLANSTLNVNAAYVQRNNNHLWGPDNDGSGSGLDADLLDGFQADAFARITAQSIGSTGYMVLSNGLKIVYGTVPLTQDAYSYATFPISFENAPAVVFPTIATVSNSSEQNTILTARTANGFTVFQAADISNVTLPYIAIGN
ncbi:gp53-like domain-containing protein [Novosphingobium pituita]|uniref:Putative tail fiber protein gp53-like C-terminal domain-containing protein n=1 Tax=Novosphingobium pituita TaxID=3056842 RepID=A0ABQ6P4U2_9SPHN|nr:hypothetical protein [Novosphingobium sp. IK01]GMM59806.1 hypothetical protein NUTIK01_05830 [Novosphingobium sp. IK01]